MKNYSKLITQRAQKYMDQSGRNRGMLSNPQSPDWNEPEPSPCPECGNDDCSCDDMDSEIKKAKRLNSLITKRAQSAKIIPQEGDLLKPDGWPIYDGAELTKEDNSYTDNEWSGGEWRIKAGSLGETAVVNLKVMGKPHYTGEMGVTKSRVKIEWVRDGGEPSDYSGGWLYQSQD